jgi:hypothetical protein
VRNEAKREFQVRSLKCQADEANGKCSESSDFPLATANFKLPPDGGLSPGRGPWYLGGVRLGAAAAGSP